MSNQKRDSNVFIPNWVDHWRPGLSANIIIDKVGLTINKSADGNPVHPFINSGSARIEGQSLPGDAGAIVSTKNVRPKFLYHEITTTTGALKSEGLLEALLAELGRSTARTLNKWLVSPTRIVDLNDPEGKFTVEGCVLKDPEEDASHIVKFAGEVPTFEEIVEMETVVLNADAYDEHTGMYVLSPLMANKLKTAPRAAGGEQMILQDGKINNYPVAVTTDSPEGFLGFGYFSYVALNECGQPDITIDDKTRATNAEVTFGIGSMYDVTTLKKEAFSIGLTPTGYEEIF